MHEVQFTNRPGAASPSACAGACVSHFLREKAPHDHIKVFSPHDHIEVLSTLSSCSGHGRQRVTGCSELERAAWSLSSPAPGPRGERRPAARSQRRREEEKPSGRFLTNQSWYPGNHMVPGWYGKAKWHLLLTKATTLLGEKTLRDAAWNVTRNGRQTRPPRRRVDSKIKREGGAGVTGNTGASRDSAI